MAPWTSILLAAAVVPYAAAAGGPQSGSSGSSSSQPTCVEEAMNNFENGGPCNLGDNGCYCESAHQNILRSDIIEACVNDSTASDNASQYVAQLCGGASGSSGSGSTTTSSAPAGSGGYQTASPSTVKTAPGPVQVSTSYPTSAPVGNMTMGSAAVGSYPASSPSAGGSGTTAAASAGTTGTTALPGVTVISTTEPAAGTTPAAGGSAPAASSPASSSSGSHASNAAPAGLVESAKLAAGFGLGAWALYVLGAMA